MEHQDRIRQLILGFLVLALVGVTTFWYLKSGAAPAFSAVQAPGVESAGNSASSSAAPEVDSQFAFADNYDADRSRLEAKKTAGTSGEARGRQNNEVTVYITGAVARPGVYTLEAGSRAGDLLRRAGGARYNADLGRVNLARRLHDEEMYRIPELKARAAATGSRTGSGSDGGKWIGDGGREGFRESSQDGTVVLSSEEAGVIEADLGRVDFAEEGSSGDLADRTPGSNTAEGKCRVNINTASAAQLEALPGIGPALAGKIIEDRRRRGPFRRVEDLVRVPGIGPRTLKNFIDLVCVD